MLKGTISFSAKLTGNGFIFPRFAFDPGIANLPAVEIEAVADGTINIIANVDQVPTLAAARNIARTATTAALNRLAFSQDIAIQPALHIGDQLQEVAGPNAVNVLCADTVQAVESVDVVKEVLPAMLKPILESAAFPGEGNYGLIRHARQSGSAVEEFTHLYTLLLTFYNDNQGDVDAFIVSEQPAVPQTPKPSRKVGTMETVYTRLRNELSHRRPGVDMEKTKEAAANLSFALRALVKRAIELHP